MSYEVQGRKDDSPPLLTEEQWVSGEQAKRLWRLRREFREVIGRLLERWAFADNVTLARAHSSPRGDRRRE